MKGFLIILFLLLCAGVIWIVPPLHARAAQMLTYNACDTPLPYHLGVIDKRFGFTNDQILNDLQQAGNIWSTAEGKNLFQYAPDAALTINFVYDQRQALNSSINSLHDNLAQNNQALTDQIAQYEKDFAAFRQKMDALNATIESYNQQGGAPKDVYDSLIKQQQELQSEGDALNTRAKQLKLSTNNYNNNVAVLNGDINQFQNVLAQKPEEGLWNGSNNTITIYLVDSRNELIHTLAHEMGHSLGMLHVKDPKAIMYPYTTPNLTVTADDMQELSYVCRDQNMIIHQLQDFDLWIIKESQTLQKQFQK